MISTNTMSTKPADRSNDDDDNIAMYKAMLYNEDLNESIHSDNAFIGGSPTQSPSRKKKVSISPNPPHKWGKPMSPEQFRPDNWLGGCGSPDSTTGSSPSRSNKGYKVKSLSMALPNLPMEDEEDNKKKTSSSTTAASEALKAISPGGGGTGAGGAGVSSSPYYGKKRSTKMPKKFQSEGGKPSSYNNNNNNNSLLPPAFAASLNSPKTIMKKKSIGTLTSSPKPKKKVNGPSLSEFFGRESSNNENSERSDYDDDLSSSVPSAFRHTLNNGINTTTSSSSRRSVGGGYGYGGGLSSSLSVSNSSVIGKYGLMSPVASKKKKVFKVPSSSASTASYNNNNNKAGDDVASSPYADIRKRLKSVSRSDMSPKKNEGQSGGGSIGVRRIQSMVGPRSLSSSNTNANERDGDGAEDMVGETSPKPKGSPGGRSISSVASAPSHVHHVSPSSTKQRALSVGSSSVSVDGGGSSSSLLSPKQPRRGRKPKSDLRMSPFRSNPRRGSEANSPMPPYSPNKRISAPPMIGSGSLLDLPFDDNDDDDVEDDDDKEKSKGIPAPPPPPPPLMEEEENEKEKSSPVVVSSTQKRTKNNGHKKVVGVDQKKFLKAMESVDETAGPPISSDPLQSSGGGPKSYYKKRSKKPMKKPASMFDRTAPRMYTPSKASMSGSKGGGGGGGSSSSSKSKMPNRSKSVRSTSPTRNRISSSRGPHKNYSISPHARQRQSEMLNTSSRSLYSTESHGSNELSNLKDIISQLRKVQLPDISKVKKRKPIKNNEHESELLDIIKNLRKVARKTNPVKSNGADDNDDGDDAVGTNYVSNTLTELKNAGYIKSKITMDELDTIEDARSRLQKVHRRLDDREYNYGQMNIVLKKLDKLTTKARSSDGNNNNVDAVPVLKEVIGKLKKMIPNLYADDKTETQDVINLLSGVVSKIGEREMDELAAVIRNFQVGRSGDDDDTDYDVDDDPEELANVIANLKSLNKGDLAGNDDKNDNDLLADAINRLRKVNMTEKDAEECGNMIRNLRKVSSGNGDKLLDDEIARLRASMGGSRSSVKKKTDEIAAVLKGLRKANLSDKGWDNLADMVKSLRPGGGDVLPDEISKVINGLKKAKLNKWEAKEVAGIVFKLRKTNYPKRLPEEEERELMVKLRKVLPNGKNDELFDLISNLRDAELDEGDIDSLVDAIENAGDDDNNDGSGMIVQVPEGDSGPSEGLPLGSDWDRGVSLRERYASNRKNGKKDDDDDTDLDDVSISTVEGDDDDSSAREEASNSNIMNSDDKDGLDLGWNRKKKKAGGDDDSSGYEEASVTSDQELEAESPNSSKRFHFSGPVIYESDNLGNEELMSPGRSPGRKQKKIVFNQKPKWKHKKHNNCVVGEKRWRFQETFGADEVLFSPLSRDQYDRRKRISQSLLANLGDDLPFSDNDKKISKKKDDDKVYTSEVVSDKVGEFMDRKKDTGRRSKYIITDESED